MPRSARRPPCFSCCVACRASVAGEYGTSAVLLVERAPADRRGLVGGWVMAACNLRFLMGSAVGALVQHRARRGGDGRMGLACPLLPRRSSPSMFRVMRRSLDNRRCPATACRCCWIRMLRHHYRTIGMIVCLVLPVAVTFYIMLRLRLVPLTERMHFSTARALDITTRWRWRCRSSSHPCRHLADPARADAR